eukprot:TRINITY_DN1074_c0_g1_i1.p1 TRINITY_DN1074_c0_g1~~TRINITY_DN1074_c0_g1_i1.p1  ORF type:complete len:349 (-),score=64.48 TRINITY_DN1074_c0_g1_i1:52-1098(-)
MSSERNAVRILFSVLAIFVCSCVSQNVLFPPWPSTYNLGKSITVQHSYSLNQWPSDATTAADAKYGLVVIDWSMDVLDNSTSQEQKMEQYGAKLKALGGPFTRVFEYRNTELGLSTFQTQRSVMYDPKFSWLWLKCGGKVCNSPALNGHQDQYFWDYRNQSTQEYFVKTVVGEIQGKSSVDGIWFDDRGGLGDEHPEVLKYFTADEIKACRAATTVTLSATMPFLHSIGKFNYFSFESVTAPQRSTCEAAVKQAIDVASKYPFIMFSWNVQQDLAQQLAGFLLSREQYAYFGTAWAVGPYWFPEFDQDYGEPVGPASETATGVFSRKWTKATVQLNCNTWEASFSFNA